MKSLPDSLMNSLADCSGFDKEAFENLHASGEQVTSIRVNPGKKSQLSDSSFQMTDTGFELSTTVSPVPWSEYGYYLGDRPSFTFDPLFHAGCYYVQEASSMFLEQALKQTIDLSEPLKVLDLSAAPGGKSTHIESILSKDSLLVSNEVIRSRANILRDNIIKWGAENVVVTNNDPRDFAVLEHFFDVMVVDAPCSGSGLFRRDPDAMDEWSLNNVTLCSQRQQRILADAWPCLKNGGLLVYSTCSYSREEDEEILSWLLGQFPAQLIPLQLHPSWGIIESGGGYRFWPDKVKGEGFFLACIRKNGEIERGSVRFKSTAGKASKKELEGLDPWIKKEGKTFVKYGQTIYAWPAEQADHFRFLLEKLKVIYSGIRVGDWLKDKLIPDHALAMSAARAESIEVVELDKQQAIHFLQRKELSISPVGKGWKLVSHKGFILGWINVLINRINNYYPKELRIVKDN